MGRKYIEKQKHKARVQELKQKRIEKDKNKEKELVDYAIDTIKTLNLK